MTTKATETVEVDFKEEYTKLKEQYDKLLSDYDTISAELKRYSGAVDKLVNAMAQRYARDITNEALGN